ncbi:hypothetical protein [Palleronia sp. LCG004]|uniref:hypothetical protein n=1 Tax=Palleronia sp. LCG004 TaxID=3079304 RepID=UPI002943C83B|nr:hypothetical protein [Palleronia sp. LCG004]WOI58073.1 hypothetical protein RVY76_17175 [Palleronia sp. LCG004]
MLRLTRILSASFAYTSAAAITALAGIGPAPAMAQNYDMDCKVILCMPAGFPGGCGDAFDHMIDRLRDGKSPIGFCSMSNGDAYDRYDIDYRMQSATSPEGWDCPADKTLYHRASQNDGFQNYTVNTFCYDSAYEQRGWTGADGYTTTTTYTNKTRPERTDFWVNLTLEPGTPEEFTQGWQKFDTGRGSLVRVQYTE